MEHPTRAFADSAQAYSEGGCGHIAWLIGAFFALQPMVTLIAVRVLGTSSQTGSAIRLSLSFASLGLAALAALGGTAARVTLSPPVRWSVAFLVLCGCSLFWSETSSVAASATYWLGTVSSFVASSLLLRDRAGVQNARALMTGFVAGAMVVALAAWAMPMQSDLRLGDEEFFNANTIAYVCSFGAFFTQYLKRSRNLGGGWVLLVLTATILRSLSKTTIVAFLVGQAWILLRDRSISRRTKSKLILAAVVLLVCFSGLFVAYFDIYTGNGNQAETLTGRTGIWAWAVDQSIERPWLGHGFDSLWKVAPLFGTFEARHAENELLEQFYTLGVVGVVVWAGCYGSLWRAIRNGKRQPGRIILSGLLVFVIVRGLAEAEPFDLLLPLWMVSLIAGLVSPGALSFQPLPAARGHAEELKAANVIGL